MTFAAAREIEESVLRIYRSSFGKVTAGLYTAGALLHLGRLVTGFAPTDIPFPVDWVIAVAATYGGIGFVLFAGEMSYRNKWQTVVHWVIALHLLISAVVHVWIIVAQSHQILSSFPVSYSYGAVLYFSAFAWVAATVRVRCPDQAAA